MKQQDFCTDCTPQRGGKKQVDDDCGCGGKPITKPKPKPKPKPPKKNLK